jgi:dTDP-4-dehydrorhamnose reductase
MNYASPITLVIGADGFLGGALVRRLRAIGEPVTGTTRRTPTGDSSRLFLDLSEQQANWRCPCPVGVSVICAGVTKLNDCHRDPGGTAYINVVRTLQLASDLVSQGAFVIYISSNAVFDGSVPYREPDAATLPVTEYGRQKAQAEKQLLQLGDLVSVVRFTKVLGPESQPFNEWGRSLRSGRPIHPFSDAVLAPVGLDFAVNVLHRVGKARLSGIVQVSGDRDVSYAEAARWGASQLGADADLVQPVERSRLQHCIEPMPAHTTLNTDRLKSALALEPPNIETAIHVAFGRPEKPAQWQHRA